MLGKELSRQSKYISYHRGLNKRDWLVKTKQNWEREYKRMEGIFFTKNGQCLDLRDVNIIKEEATGGLAFPGSMSASTMSIIPPA